MSSAAWTAVVLVLLVSARAIEWLCSALRIRSRDSQVPQEFDGIYPEDEYARADEYKRARTRVSLVEDGISFAALLAFWFAGGFPWLDGLAFAASAGTGGGEIVRGLAFIGGLALGGLLLGLPFNVWRTFIVEERFGFNRTRPARFILDLILGIIVGIALGGPLLAIVLWLLSHASATAWIICWAVLGLYQLAALFIIPRWVFPLFWRFRPLSEGDLRDAVLAYTKRVDFPVENVFVIDGSRRSTKSNAFFAGFGRTRRLALFDTLIERQGLDELVAVVAHEVGHWKRGHLVRSLAVGFVQNAVLLAVLAFVLGQPALFAAFGVGGTPVHVGLVIFALIWSPIGLAAGALSNALSRRHEYEADRFAAETIADPEALVRALRKLSVDNLVDLRPHRLDVILHASHPPMPMRVRALRQVAAQGGR